MLTQAFPSAMKRYALLLPLAVLLSLATIAGAVEVAPAPAPPSRPATDTYFGVAVVDPYRNLETASPETLAWDRAQNDRATSYLHSLPQYGPIAAEVRKLIDEQLVGYYEIRYRRGMFFALKFDPKVQQPYLVAMRSADDPASARTILDPNALDRTGHIEIDWYEPSLDGKFVAVSLSENGSEAGTVHVYETATLRELPDRIPRAQFPTGGGSLAWNADGSGFYYTRYPDPGERTGNDAYLYQQVYFHALGASPSSDTYCIGKDFPKVAETALTTSRDGKYVLAAVANGDGGQFSYFLLGPSGGWRTVATDSDAVVYADFGGDDSLYLLSYKAGLRGSVLRLGPGQSSLPAARTILAEGRDPIEGIKPVQDKVYVFYIDGGPSILRVANDDGSDLRDVPIPPVSSAGAPKQQVGGDDPVWLTGDSLLFHSSTFSRPSAWMRYTPGAGDPTRTALSRVSRTSLADMQVVRDFAVSKDGTRVPMTILMRKGTKLDGNNPTLIYGYGGYGIGETPSFNPGLRLWLDGGGIYVDTNIRGGNDYGEAWHRGGYLTNKQNVFDDFAACAQRLIDAGYTKPSRLAALGGSNGGLLMGAMITQHPGLFKCIVSERGLYDMLRSENEPNGQFNTTEYGTVKEQPLFNALYAYSPYHHVTPGARYPDILFTIGENDMRVDAMQSRKMTARLQAADPRALILFCSNPNSGHGLSSSLDEATAEQANQEAFLFSELGMTLR